MAVELWHVPFTEQDEVFFPAKLFFKAIRTVTKGLWSSGPFGLYDDWATELSEHGQFFFLLCHIFCSQFIENRMTGKFIFLNCEEP